VLCPCVRGASETGTIGLVARWKRTFLKLGGRMDTFNILAIRLPKHTDIIDK